MKFLEMINSNSHVFHLFYLSKVNIQKQLYINRWSYYSGKKHAASKNTLGISIRYQEKLISSLRDKVLKVLSLNKSYQKNISPSKIIIVIIVFKYA